MSNKRLLISNMIRAPKRRQGARTILALAVGIGVFGWNTAMKAQDPAQGAGSVQPNAADPAPPPGPASGSLSGVYLINPNDQLDIYVFDVPELSHTYSLSASGAISMPLLSKPIQAAGLTPDQVAHAIEEAFRQSGRLQRPEIAVSVKPSPTSSVAVEGAVRIPQLIPMIAHTKLVDVLTQCGGLADDAGTTATITRSTLTLRDIAAAGGLATPTLTVELKRIMDVEDPASTIAVWPGDRVHVERRLPEVYYVLGEVKIPGGYALKRGGEELTVLRAVAIAGDLTSVAKKNKAMIIRKDSNASQGRQEIKLDLQGILAGKTPDPVLQADDILFVPGSNGKKALHTIEAAPAMILAGAGTAAIIH